MGTLDVTEYLTKPVSNDQLVQMFSNFDADGKGKVLVVDPDASTAEQVRNVLGEKREVLHAATS